MNAIHEIKEGEMLFVYNSDSFRDREALGYAKSIPNLELKEVDIVNYNVTEQQLMDMTYRLDIGPAELIDRKSDVFSNKYEGKQLSDEDILTAIKNNPNLLKTPIALLRDEAYFVGSPYDFVKKGLSIEGIKPRVDEKNRED